MTHNGIPLENPVIFADAYILFLKHYVKGKFSARSTSILDDTMAPYKKKKNDFRNTIKDTPVRIFGEMEQINLMLSKSTEELKRLKFTYSSSPKNRKKLIHAILDSEDGEIEDIDLVENDDVKRDKLDALLAVMGIKLDNDCTG